MASPKNRLEAGGATAYPCKLTPQEKEQQRVRARMWDEAEAEADTRESESLFGRDADHK